VDDVARVTLPVIGLESDMDLKRRLTKQHSQDSFEFAPVPWNDVKVCGNVPLECGIRSTEADVYYANCRVVEYVFPNAGVCAVFG
jgi:hypothetical protein